MSKFTVEELKNFKKELLDTLARNGVSMDAAEKVVDAVKLTEMEDMDFIDMISDLSIAGMDAGIPSDMIETVLAEAIHNREKVVSATYTEPQKVYGPAPVGDTVTVEYHEPVQCVYGPAPEVEVHEAGPRI